MGFFSSPGLSFASTIGSFVGGAAKEANHQYEEDRKRQEQDDALQQAWAAKTDRAISEWNKENKQYQTRAGLFKSLKDVANGDEAAAEFGMRAFDANPKTPIADIINIVASRQKAGNNYQSGYNDELTSEAKVKYDQITKQYNSFKPKYQRFLASIEPPSFGGQSGQPQQQSPSPFNAPTQQAAPQQQIASNNPQPIGNSSFTPPQPGNQPAASPFESKSEPTGNPNLTMNSVEAPLGGSTPSATSPANPYTPPNTQGAAGNLGPTSADSTQIPGQVNPPQSAPNPLTQTPPSITTANPQTITLGPLQVTPEQAQEIKKFYGEFPKPPEGGVMTKEIQRAQQAWLANARQAIHELNQTQQKAPNPGVQAGIDAMKNIEEDYVKNAKTGLNTRYMDADSLLRQSMEVNSMADILNRGFKSDQLQPTRDALTKLLYAFGQTPESMGIDFAKYNSPGDINTLQKDVANNLISRLQTLHFGRITNYEASTLKQGFADAGKDPDTNLRVTLIQKSLLQRNLDELRAERNAYYNALPKNLGPNDVIPISQMYNARTAAENARLHALDNYMQQHPEAPWPQINAGPNVSGQQRQELINSLPKGQWIENKANGRMFYIRQDGRVVRAGEPTGE